MFLCVVQDGAARPMTAVRAAGYSSSIARGAFTRETHLHILLEIYMNGLIMIFDSSILTPLVKNMTISFILIV